MEPVNKRIHKELLDAYKAAHPSKDHGKCDSEVSALWKGLKADKQRFPENVRLEIRKLKDIAKTKKSTLDKYWSGIPKQTSRPSANPPTPSPPAVTGAGETSPQVESSSSRLAVAPKQEELKSNISNLTIEVSYLLTKKNKGLATVDEEALLKVHQAQLLDYQKQLKKLEDGQKRSQRKRDRDKTVFQELEETNPDLAKKLRKHEVRGRPRLEESQPGLLEAIVEIATYGNSSMANDRRRSEDLRTIKSLKDLTEALQHRGFLISESATYRRLLPKRALTSEGKRHVVTVPVRLARATNDLRKEHSDTQFCRTSINYLEELASILGPRSVIFLSQDDKARIPIGLTAANKQCPLLMHLEYRIKLPDHDFVVADRHKLIPSVYALIDIKPDKCGSASAVGYTGPTFVAIRSGKHSSSNAGSHGRDLTVLFEKPEFVEYCKQEDGSIKPVLILTVDGGPDENPRYEKVQKVAITHFKRWNLDALFIATNAPGRSAYNRVERRMAPLSKELSGLILEHDHYGSHLNESRKTIDSALEKKNFEHAGKTLSDIWSNMTLDNHPVVAEYVSPEESEMIDIVEVTSAWRSVHVREGHYFFQVIKCLDSECCSPMRSCVRNVIGAFMPSPMSVVQTPSLQLEGKLDMHSYPASLLLRLKLDDSSFKVKENEVPFDLSCPSLINIFQKRCCPTCGIYHASQKSLVAHRKVCRLTQSAPTEANVRVDLSLELQGRPVRVAARRQREKMIVWTSRINDEHADWFHEDELAGIDATESDLRVENEDMPVITIDNYMASAFENA